MIADIYFWLHHEEYKNNSQYKGTNIEDSPITSHYNSKLEEAYSAFYFSCLRHGLEHEHINVFNSILSKTDISDEEIQSVKESAKFMDYELDMKREIREFATNLRKVNK